ncbi:hypothetical protein DMJ13_01805 [halophilic archaeon]|nr:hypothetical protein DMJ13_01805 [halophilic archaeon]
MGNQSTDREESLTQGTSAPAGPDSDVPSLSQDALFDALTSRRSRYVLHYLRRSETPVTVADLVESVAAWETDKAIDLVSNEHLQNVRTSLRHTQLPKLAMAGLVQYDEDRDLVDQGVHAEQAEAYLDIAITRDDAVSLED